MRITGGVARGRKVVCPEGLAVRPTASKVRQAFFNILGGRTVHAHFLDLFAGSGLMGLEALSRGAASLVAVEENKRQVKAIEDSLKLLGFELQGEVIAGDIRRVIPILEPEHYDIVFADPPYQSSLAASALTLVDRHRLVSARGVLAIEHARQLPPEAELANLDRFDTRNYGQTSISFYRYIDRPE